MQPVVEELQSNGYAQVDLADLDMSAIEFAKELAGMTGKKVSDAADRLIASPIGVKPKNTYGGNYGYGPLPLHTDLAHWYRPPRYVILSCIVPAESVRTYVLHRRAFKEWIPESALDDALFSPRRRLDGKLFLLRMCDENLVRWDQLFLKPQNRAARDVVSRMREISFDSHASDVIFDRHGKTLIVDNWNVLHGRSSVPSHAIAREIERIYLEE